MLIDFKKVNIYQDERLILKDIDFQATEGEFIYLIGRVGSGKSSLLKTFYGELDIDQEDAEKAEVLYLISSRNASLHCADRWVLSSKTSNSYMTVQ